MMEKINKSRIKEKLNKSYTETAPLCIKPDKTLHSYRSIDKELQKTSKIRTNKNKSVFSVQRSTRRRSISLDRGPDDARVPSSFAE